MSGPLLVTGGSGYVVFDGEKGAPYVEEDEPTPVTAYGRDKADAEPGRHERVGADPDAVFFTDEVRSPVHVGARAVLVLGRPRP